MQAQAVIAEHRFGFGVQRGGARQGGQALLKAQLGRTSWPPVPGGLPSSTEFASSTKTPQRMSQSERIDFAKRAYEIYVAEVAYRLGAAIANPDGFRERLVWFWSNHFTVSSTNILATGYLGSMEREAIRPHVTGRFADMLKAVTRHPAMLIYLDNFQSIGPGSRAGRLTKRGLNENLARELLELHTLGVDGGYAQADVIALAKILTGWGVAFGSDARGGAYMFYANRHEPGAKTLLGKHYEFGDERDGLKALDDLARHPSTAQNVALRLAVHFLGGLSSQGVVDRLASVFQRTDGDLAAVSMALVEEATAFSTALTVMRPPCDFVVAAVRALAPEFADSLEDVVKAALDGKVSRDSFKPGARGALGPGLAIVAATQILGQFPFAAPSPKGWPDGPGSWIAPEAIIERIEWGYQLADRLPARTAPDDLAESLLGPFLSPQTLREIDLAATPAQGIALLLASPEMQRR